MKSYKRVIKIDKKIVIAALLSVFIFSGCSAAGSAANKNAQAKAGQATQNVSKITEKSQVTQTKNAGTSSNAVKSSGVPQLSSKQKSQISSKLDTTINSLNDALNSIQDPSDVNLDSIK